MKSTPKIYLAGPEVFLPNADQIGHQKKALCNQYGFEGLFPLDTELGAQAQQREARDLGFAISAANERLIEICDILIANLTPFRGPSADVGTVYELGLARGLGKPIYGYSHCQTPYTDRVWRQFGITNPNTGQLESPCIEGGLRDRAGLKIEEFDLNDNLMLEGGIQLSGGNFWRKPLATSDAQVSGGVHENTHEALNELTGFEALLIQISTQG